MIIDTSFNFYADALPVRHSGNTTRFCGVKLYPMEKFLLYQMIKTGLTCFINRYWGYSL